MQNWASPLETLFRKLGVGLVHQVGLIMQIPPSSSLAEVRAVMLIVKQWQQKQKKKRLWGKTGLSHIDTCVFPLFAPFLVLAFWDVFSGGKNQGLYRAAVDTSRFHSDTLLHSCRIWAVSVATPVPRQALIRSRRPQRGGSCSPSVPAIFCLCPWGGTNTSREQNIWANSIKETFTQRPDGKLRI